MSVRYEGAYAKDTTVSVAQAGEIVGQDEMPEGQIALLLSYDEVFYIQGTRSEVLDVLIDALERVVREVRP